MPPVVLLEIYGQRSLSKAQSMGVKKDGLTGRTFAQHEP